MLKLLLVSNGGESLFDFDRALKEMDDVETLHALSGEKALEMIKDDIIDLVVTDEDVGDMSGLSFVRKLISFNPMINCVAVSSLSEKDFHEASEGLGLMNHLPVNPGKTEAKKLIQSLRHIMGLESIKIK